MKKIHHFLTLLTLVFVSTFSAVAQDYFDYEWEHHSIVFTLPDDFKPTTNTADEFYADGDAMSFGLYPFSDATVNEDDIAAFTVEIAKSVKLQEVDDADVITLNGLKGAYVEGYKDGARVVLCGLIDPTSDTNFFALITFGDDDKVAEDEAVRIFKSFRHK